MSPDLSYHILWLVDSRSPHSLASLLSASLMAVMGLSQPYATNSRNGNVFGEVANQPYSGALSMDYILISSIALEYSARHPIQDGAIGT